MAASIRKEVSRLLVNSNAGILRFQRHVCNKPPTQDALHTPGGLPTMDGYHTTSAVDRLAMFSWLSQYGPAFHIRGDRVQVITEPAQFYEVLKVKTRKARKRITFASLYLGNGDLEKDLVSCMKEACLTAVTSGNSQFEVNILLDYTRGSRGKVNSRSMLRPLMAQFNGVRVSLYHTPDLRGVLKKIMPERFNETIGLTHVKVYLFDDSFIISGANLSNDYFTNRQDRYILFNDCPELANFFHDLVKTIMSFSFALTPDDSLHLRPDWNIHPYKDSDDGLRFKLAAREKIQACLDSPKHSGDMMQTLELEGGHTREVETSRAVCGEETEGEKTDTIVYPLVQMEPFGVNHDEQAMLALLRSSQPQDNLLLASGYFNLTDHYMSVILDQSVAKFSILMASPQANGFLGARGVAGAIPYSYVYLARQFFKQLLTRGQTQRIHLQEYTRDGWTFHGKGLWYYLPSQTLPSLTLVGSPNFGYRSVYRDLECQLAVVTENSGLREQLREEHVRMFSWSQPVTASTFERRDRYVPWWIRIVTKIIKHFF